MRYLLYVLISIPTAAWLIGIFLGGLNLGGKFGMAGFVLAVWATAIALATAFSEKRR